MADKAQDTQERAEVSELPLEGITVVAIEQYGAGPWATLQLADMGATVIKVEDPSAGGDVGRHVPPFASGGDSLFFQTLNRNKSSIALDLANPRGREVLERLIAKADALFSNLRGDLPERLRLTYADLKGINPRIVCCSLSGFGMTGPRRSDPGYDYMMQGLAGWMSLTGDPGGPPTKSGLSLVDLSGGYVAAIAIQAGIIRAWRTGQGGDADLSLFETALSLLSYVGTWTATGEYSPSRMRNSAHPSIVPFQNFETSDGWVVVACAKQKFWERFCRAVGGDGLAQDRRFNDLDARNRNREILLPMLEAILAAETTEHWLNVFAQHNVPSAPVNSVEQALRDPQARAREDVVEIAHPQFGPVQQIASPLRFDGPSAPLKRAPLLDEDSDAILGGLCELTEAQVADLRNAGAFGARTEKGGGA